MCRKSASQLRTKIWRAPEELVLFAQAQELYNVWESHIVTGLGSELGRSERTIAQTASPKFL